MGNPGGYNGSDNGTVPPEDVLREALMRYARERRPLKQRIQCLADEFDYYIGMTKLNALNKKYNVPSARKPPPLPDAISLICEKMYEDVDRRKGPNRIMKELSSEGHIIPRAVVRQVMLDNDPSGFDLRYPGGPTYLDDLPSRPEAGSDRMARGDETPRTPAEDAEDSDQPQK